MNKPRYVSFIMRSTSHANKITEINLGPRHNIIGLTLPCRQYSFDLSAFCGRGFSCRVMDSNPKVLQTKRLHLCSNVKTVHNNYYRTFHHKSTDSTGTFSWQRRNELNSRYLSDCHKLWMSNSRRHKSLGTSRMGDKDVFEGCDETQIKLMQEECILVDENDNNIGSASKKTCHLLENINKGMLHRAFSVFLFNTKGELLLQQRAEEKITYPDHFTNTCCSHPLNIAGEVDERNAIGVKRAAQRKLNHELGIKPEQIPLEDFHFLTRMLYKARNIPEDNKWGEYEIDYVLIIQKDVNIQANPNEVKSYRYINKEDLKNFVDSADSKGLLLTPWFKLIAKNFLYKWWNSLDKIDTLAEIGVIHRMV